MSSIFGIDPSNTPVWVPLESRTQGTYVLGKNGTGKTTFLLWLIIQDIVHGRGVCVLDPHGDLVDDVLVRVPADRCDDVILLDLRASETPFGLNLFQCADPSDPILAAETTEQVVQVFEKIWGDLSWGPLLEDLLGNIAHTMIENPGYTMAEVPRLLTDDAFRQTLLASVRNQVIKDFWQYEYDPMSDRDQRENRRSTLNKVRDFLRNPLIRNIVGQAETTVDFAEVIERKKILLIKLDSRLENATSLIGSMMVQQLLNAALGRRNRSEREPFMLYADEYHRFATPAFGTLIDEARKYGIATTIAHQRRSQLRPGEHRAAPLGAVNLVVFSVLGEDAEELSKQFDATPPPPQVTGERPIRVLAVDPLNQILRHGHTNPAIHRLAQQVSETIERWVASEKLRVAERYYQPDTRWMDDKTHELLHAVERYLSQAQRGAIPPPEEKPTPEAFLYFLRNREDLRAWRQSLLLLAFALKEYPVRISSNEYEPLYATPRLYSDMHGEIANQLTTLPSYTAKAKLRLADGTREYHLRTLAPPQEISACVVTASGRPRCDIEAEIARRSESIESSEDVLAEEVPPTQAPKRKAPRRPFH